MTDPHAYMDEYSVPGIAYGDLPNPTYSGERENYTGVIREVGQVVVGLQGLGIPLAILPLEVKTPDGLIFDQIAFMPIFGFPTTLDRIFVTFYLNGRVTAERIPLSFATAGINTIADGSLQSGIGFMATVKFDSFVISTTLATPPATIITARAARFPASLTPYFPK